VRLEQATERIVTITVLCDILVGMKMRPDPRFVVLAASTVCALAGLSLSGDSRQSSTPPVLRPVAVELGSPAIRRGGLLDFIDPFSDRDTAPTEQGLTDALNDRPWIRLVHENAEAAVAVRWQQRNASIPSRSKDGKRVTITFTYKASAAVATRREKDQVDAEATSAKTYSSNASRKEPTPSEDRDGFQRAGKELGSKVRAWVLARIETLRPEGPDPGFRHRIKHKLLIMGDGLEVTDVAPDSPAARAGLRPGDRIRKVEGEDGTNQMDERVLTWRLSSSAVPVSIEVERDKKRQMIAFEIAAPRR
jgi:membrane-associated protease RseP (regulator of RpoE activity)